MANILVLNAGSGSQKVALYAIHSNSMAVSAPVWEAAINSTTPSQPEGYFVAQITSARGKDEIRVPRNSPLPEKLETLVRASWEGQSAALEMPDQIDLVGHRVVHGGLEFSCATLINPQVESTIERLELSLTLTGINESRRHLHRDERLVLQRLGRKFLPL